VESAPIPPHERSWRHPSELGPPAHEPTSTSGRVIIATAATLSLLLIGLLAISMTPDKGAAPQTMGSTTSGSGAATEELRVPLVTPIGDDGWAITTTGAVKARSGKMSARLPSGDVVEVEIVHRDDDAGITIVSLPTQTQGYHLARSQPGPTDTVAVRGTETQVVEMANVSTLDVEEGAAVVDGDGDLVGLCTTTEGTVEVRSVSTMPGTSSTTSTSSSPSTSSTVPPTTVAPTTVAPTTDPAPTTGPVTVPPSTTAPATSTSSTTAPSTTSTTGPSTSDVTGGVVAASGAPS
jgi:hypothetical protein